MTTLFPPRSRLTILVLIAMATGRVEAGFFVQDLGVLPNPNTGLTTGQTSGANAVNAYGQTSGMASTAGSFTQAVVSSVGGKFQSSGAPAGSVSSVATSINIKGDTAGSFVDANDAYRTHAFITAGKTSTDLGTFNAPGFSNGSAKATGINASDVVVGTGNLNTPSQRAFYASLGSSMSVINPLGTGLYDVGNGINDKGVVVGTSQISPGGSVHAFIADSTGGGTLAVDLTSLHSMPGFGQNSYGVAINTAGYVTGYADYNGGEHAFLTSPTANTAAIDIGVLGGATSSYAYGLNDYQQVVGSMNNNAAFLWDPAAGLFDLNTLLSVASQAQWTLETATGINDNGQISGIGYSNADHALHGFLLTPVPGEPIFAPYNSALVPAPPTLVLSGLACVFGLGFTGSRRLRKSRHERTGGPAIAGPDASSPGR